MRSSAQSPTTPTWLHRWAVFTVVMTVILLALGAIVTTFRVGMADPIWPTYPWHLLLIDWAEPSSGFLIEHSHRLAGYLLGCCVIVLAVGLALAEPRRWVRRLGWAALLGVIFQGLLGGFRVRLHAWLGTDLAALHGCFAQLVFALLVGIAMVTSRGWWSMTATKNGLGAPRRGALACAVLLYLQIILGALLRHAPSPLAQRLHVLMAFVAVLSVAWLVKSVLERRERWLVAPAWLLAALTAFQVSLGVEALVMRFGSGVPVELQAQVPWGQAFVRTLHVLVGFGLLATAVALTLRTYRLALVPPRLTVPAAEQLEEVA